MVGLAADPRVFMLVFRAIDAECDLRELRAPFPVTLATEVRVRWCPWCGANLARVYGKQSALPRLSKTACGSSA